MASKYQQAYRKTEGKSDKNVSEKSALEVPTLDDEDGSELAYVGRRESQADVRTVASRQHLHDKMQNDVEAFLSRGGKINRVDTTVTADPPKRPISRYGHRPL